MPHFYLDKLTVYSPKSIKKQPYFECYDCLKNS